MDRKPIKSIGHLMQIVDESEDPVWVLTGPSQLMSMPFAVMHSMIANKQIKCATFEDVQSWTTHHPNSVIPALLKPGRSLDETTIPTTSAMPSGSLPGTIGGSRSEDK